MNITKRIGTAVLLAATVLSMAACGSDPLSDDASSSGSSDSIVIGSADFTESQLIAAMYSQALQKQGVDVEEKFNIGSREVYMEALQDGSIDLVPEYSGTLLNYLDTSSTETDPTKIMTDLTQQLPSGIIALDASQAEDVDVIAVQKAFSEEHDVENIYDLKELAPSMILGGPSEWKSRYIGVEGLQEVYGLQFKEFQVLDAGGPLTLAALKGGQVQAGDMFSSDPAIVDNDLLALEDDQHLFASAQIVPVLRESKASSEVKSTLNAISEKLTTESLTEMNREINNGADVATVAQDWLTSEQLI